VLSARQDDLQPLRDRPCVLGARISRPVPSTKVPGTAIAEATPVSEHTTIKSFEPKPRTPEIPRAELKAPYSPDNSAAQVEAQQSTQSALHGSEDELAEPVTAPSVPRAGKSKPTAKLSVTKQKVIAEQVPRKSRFARRRGGRGLGLFALSGEFGRPTR